MSSVIPIILIFLILWISAAIWVIIQIADKDCYCTANGAIVLIILALIFPFIIVPLYLIYTKRHEKKREYTAFNNAYC